jgi:hypothetical protein
LGSQRTHTSHKEIAEAEIQLSHHWFNSGNVGLSVPPDEAPSRRKGSTLRRMMVLSDCSFSGRMYITQQKV